MSKLEAELMKATKIKGPKAKEDRPAFLKRLVGAAQDLEDEDWEKLSEPAQKWVNAGATALNDDNDVKDFSDAKKAAPDKKAPAKSRARDDDDGDDGAADDGDADDNSADDGDDEGGEKVAKKTTAKKGAAKKAAPAKKEAAPAKKAPAKAKGGGAQVAIKRAVIADPKASTESIAAKLEKKGIDVTPAAVSTIRSGTLQTLRLVKEIGMPKGDF